MVFLVVIWMWQLDLKEGSALNNWCFGIVFWRRPLRVPWTARRSNQSILKEIKREYSLGVQMLNLQYLGYLIQRADSLEKTDAGKDRGQEEKGMTEDKRVGWHYWLDEHEFEQTLGDSKGQGSPVCCSPWSGRVGHDWVTQSYNQDGWPRSQGSGRCWPPGTWDAVPGCCPTPLRKACRAVTALSSISAWRLALTYECMRVWLPLHFPFPISHGCLLWPS